jgi:hypothetical protein
MSHFSITSYLEQLNLVQEDAHRSNMLPTPLENPHHHMSTAGKHYSTKFILLLKNAKIPVLAEQR